MCICLCIYPNWNRSIYVQYSQNGCFGWNQCDSVQVEVDISTGMPVFDMVGNLTSEVREAKERVKTALHSVGIVLPAKRITVNLSPANIKKTEQALICL